MTLEQERAEARIDKAKLLEWIDQRRVKASTKEAHDEVVRIERSIKRGAFDSNSLDREEQLIAENEKLKAYLTCETDAYNGCRARAYEQDKEIQQLKKDYSELEDQAATWREESGN